MMSAQQYQEAVERIEKRNPDEILLPTLRSGYCRINEVYLRAAMRRLSTVSMEKIPHPREQKYADANLRDLWRERTELFGQMNKLSNHFHDCKSDDERAANSRSIRVIWGKILEVKDRIEYYEQHGELPAPADEERFPIPDDLVEIVKKQLSLRAQISQRKRQLDGLAGLHESDPERAKIADIEAKLAELKLYLGHLGKAIEQRARVYAG